MQHLPGITPWCIFRRGKVRKQGLKVRHKVPYSVFFPFLVGCHTGASVTFSFTHFKLNQTLKLWMFDHKTPHHHLDLGQLNWCNQYFLHIHVHHGASSVIKPYVLTITAWYIMVSQVLAITGKNNGHNNWGQELGSSTLTWFASCSAVTWLFTVFVFYSKCRCFLWKGKLTVVFKEVI